MSQRSFCSHHSFNSPHITISAPPPSSPPFSNSADFSAFVPLSYIFTLPWLSSFSLSVSLCHLFLSLHCPHFSHCSVFLSGWKETLGLLQGILFLPYWPTSRKESRLEMSLECLFFWLPTMSACQALVCVRTCVSYTRPVVIIDRVLLWHITQLCHTWGQNCLIRSTHTNMYCMCGFNLFILIGGLNINGLKMLYYIFLFKNALKLARSTDLLKLVPRIWQV